MKRFQQIEQWALSGNPAVTSTEDVLWLVAVARAAANVRTLQQRYYQGDKSILGECKVAERELDTLIAGEQGTITF